MAVWGHTAEQRAANESWFIVILSAFHHTGSMDEYSWKTHVFDDRCAGEVPNKLRLTRCIVQAFEPFIKLTLPLTSAISWQPAILPRSAIFCICRIFQSCWKSVFRSVLSFNPRTELFLYDVLVCVLKRPPKCVLIISWVSSPKHTVNRNWKVEQKERKWD